MELVNMLKRQNLDLFSSTKLFNYSIVASSDNYESLLSLVEINLYTKIGSNCERKIKSG